MDILQSWIAQKGDGAAVALAPIFQRLNWPIDDLIAEIQGERKAKKEEELSKQRKEAEALGIDWINIKAEELVNGRLDAIG